ncbi:MAG TPA: branched-chain amino acid aminotransferase [Alphaproteobacteria bacterium]|nr:branched-chain amino acid aminotransferase [Alphaproteobacteria bacterium]
MAKSITWYEGGWHDGNVPLLTADDHATWLSSMVFDGARSFQRQAPDLDLHCARAARSATIMGLAPTVQVDTMLRLCWEGIERFPPAAELYVRPMFFARGGFLVPDPATTAFALTLWELPMPGAKGFSACITRFRRPSPETAPTDAKASCLYPNVSRMFGEAKARGFDSAVALDLNGNVAEFASSNLFMAKNGVVATPVLNGTFLAGVTRHRVIQLLRDDGKRVEERTIGVADLMDADEVFSTGNYGKVQPATRIEDRVLQPGPFFRRAHELYFDFAKRCTKPATL